MWIPPSRRPAVV
jgi:cytochrome c-type biogenesis protein CcmE